MSDPRHVNLAKLLVNYCVEVKPGDKVLINGGLVAKPLMLEVYREILEAGGHPMTRFSETEFQEILLKYGNDEQLKHIPEPIKLIIETFDCQIGLWSDENTRTLSGVDPLRQQMSRTARTELMEISMKRSASGDFRWVGTMYPTNARAQEADMSLREFEDFVYSACHVDKANPVAEWTKVSETQQILVDWLAGKESVKVKGPNVDLSLSISGRTFINSNGKKNMPSGEIFTGPVEDSVEGHVRFQALNCSLKMARSLRLRLRKMRIFSTQHWNQMMAPNILVNSLLARTTASSASPSQSFSMRRWVAPYTWPLALAIRKQAALTGPAFTGI